MTIDQDIINAKSYVTLIPGSYERLVFDSIISALDELNEQLKDLRYEMTEGS